MVVGISFSAIAALTHAFSGSHLPYHTSDRVSDSAGSQALLTRFRHHHGLPRDRIDELRDGRWLGRAVSRIQTYGLGTGTRLLDDDWRSRLDRERSHPSDSTVRLHDQLWIALAIMIAESTISLLPITISYTTTLIRHRRQRSSGVKVFHPSLSPSDSIVTEDDYFESSAGDDDLEHEPPERLVPTRWVWWGLGSSAVLGVVLVWIVFGVDGIHPWATAVGLGSE